jgi:hypothetical protein
MSETVQTVVVLLLVLLAAAYVARRAWAAVRPARDAGCASGCGCGSGAAANGNDWAKT